MSEVREIRMEDENGNIYYPHNTGEVTFLKDGRTVQEFFDNGGDIRGSVTIEGGTELKALAVKRTMTEKEYKSVFGIIGIGSNGKPSAQIRLENTTDSNIVGIGITETGFVPSISDDITLGSNISVWKSLYTLGGRIYHTATVGANGSYVIEPQEGKQLIFNVTSADGLKVNQIKMYASDNGERGIIPAINGVTSLGSNDFRFSDIWLNQFSKSENGYTKLPNGFILQWGTITMGQGFQYATYPISFPNKTLFCDATVIFNVTSNNNGAVNTAFANAIPSSVSQSQITLHQLSGSTNTYRVAWFAIGH